MPPLVILAAVGAGALLGYRVFKAVTAPPAAADAPEQTKEIEPKNLGTLEYDAKNGVYRPRS